MSLSPEKGRAQVTTETGSWLWAQQSKTSLPHVNSALLGGVATGREVAMINGVPCCSVFFMDILCSSTCANCDILPRGLSLSPPNLPECYCTVMATNYTVPSQLVYHLAIYI